MNRERIEAALQEGRETAGGDGYYIDQFVIDGDLSPVVAVIARLVSEAVAEALEAVLDDVNRKIISCSYRESDGCEFCHGVETARFIIRSHKGARQLDPHRTD